MRVSLRLNDQQLALLDRLRGTPGLPDTLDALVATALRHDMARAPDPRRARPRPAGRPASPRDAPGTRLDQVVDAGTGLGVPLRAGERVRVEQVVEGQCADVNVFALGDGEGRRRFDAARTRAAHGLRPSTGAVLWSNAPELALMEIGVDTAGPHDLGFPACSAAEFTAVTGQADHSNCVDLQRETQRHWGLDPTMVHDPLNLWLPTDVLPDGRLCFWPAACRRGDHVELRALTDVLVVVNPCASDVYGSAQWELGPIRVVVVAEDPAPPAVPSGPEPEWRWRALPVRDVEVTVPDDARAHVAAVRAGGWFGFSDAEVTRALLLRWWEDAVLQLGEVSR
jgi:uncharacterized protein YcgI (DUF1989 family)